VTASLLSNAQCQVTYAISCTMYTAKFTLLWRKNVSSDTLALLPNYQKRKARSNGRHSCFRSCGIPVFVVVASLFRSRDIPVFVVVASLFRSRVIPVS